MAAHQRSGRGHRLHGKVEIGQNARTSLTQAVAEELRLPIESIRLVMADTDLTPFDMGTSGSGTTPRMAPQLRRAAATARELLIDMAAKRLSVDRGSLAVSDGKVVHAPSKRSLTFGELAKDKHFTKDGRFRRARHAGCKVEDRGHLGSQGRSPRDRDRQASIRFRRSAAGNAVWENPAAAQSQCVPEIGEPQRGPGRSAASRSFATAISSAWRPPRGRWPNRPSLPFRRNGRRRRTPSPTSICSRI